jgi:hypothetical protein
VLVEVELPEFESRSVAKSNETLFELPGRLSQAEWGWETF